jgi:hypothetical protein
VLTPIKNMYQVKSKVLGFESQTNSEPSEMGEIHKFGKIRAEIQLN